MSGAGSTADAIVSTDGRVDSCRPDPERGQRAFGRFAVVGRGDGDPEAALAQPVEQGVQVGQRPRGRDRSGGVPGHLECPRSALASLAHSRRWTAATSRVRSRRWAIGVAASPPPAVVTAPVAGSNPSIV